MKLLFLFLASLALTTSGYGQPQPTATAEQRSADQEAVHKAIEEIVAAIDRNDADAFDRLSTADYTYVNPAGRVWNKSKYLEVTRSGSLKVESYTRDEESIRLYGDTAVVIYRSSPKGTLGGQELISNPRRVTTIMVKQDGRWLTAGQQSTPILPPPPK